MNLHKKRDQLISELLFSIYAFHQHYMLAATLLRRKANSIRMLLQALWDDCDAVGLESLLLDFSNKV